MLEETTIKTVEKGQMTKDLALSVHGSEMRREHWLSTQDFIGAVAENLRKELVSPKL